eukprot:gnl/Spiro4/13855_TR7399_c0_g1_i1.p2 gnl/Spiro4/13855_TR7399_c0_g1~~gnl/Spiro4/13855_TR7399_c0_g1_i1.p2  ORF type:complete len:167 (+),score=26.02 gnl/Spiro4/13855_TR7399_c0_g1_i1:39-503(+)
MTSRPGRGRFSRRRKPVKTGAPISSTEVRSQDAWNSVPHRLLLEALGQSVRVETKAREEYAGVLLDVEGEGRNLSLGSVRYTNRAGVVAFFEQMYLRGSKVCLIELPQVLADAVSSLPLTVLLPESETASDIYKARRAAQLASRGKSTALRPNS